MHRISFGEPHVAVNPSALVEPSFGQSGVHADGQNVFVSEIYEIRHVKTKRRVTTEVFAQVVTVEHDHGVAKRSVELHGNTLPGIRGRKIEDPAVPSDTGLGIVPANRLRSVVRKHGRGFLKGKFYRPV